MFYFNFAFPFVKLNGVTFTTHLIIFEPFILLLVHALFFSLLTFNFEFLNFDCEEYTKAYALEKIHQELQ